MRFIGLTLHIPATGAPKMGGLFAAGKASVRGLVEDMRFGDTLARKLESATDGSDAASQLAALLAGGLPVADATNRIAASLTTSVARAFNGRIPLGMQQQLQRALASALAPPGTSPPLSLAQQAQTLVQRLRSTIETLTRETKTDAGQQSRFSGDILDAVKTAKDIPAQTAEPVPTDSIVADVIAQLRAAASASSSSPSQPPLQSAAKSPPPHASDIVGRTIARALNAGALQPQIAAAPKAAAVAPAGAHAAPVPAAVLFQRLIAIVAQSAQAQTGDGKRNAGDAFEKAAPDVSNAGADQPIAQNASSFAIPVARELAAASPAAPAPHTVIDAQALIDQVIKGFAVRTSGSTSEVRMRLHPDQLGDVSLKLTVNGSTIDASIVAQNADVRQTLVANQHQLAQALSDAGLALGTFSVDVSGGQGGRSNEQQAQLGKKTVARVGLAAESDDDAAEPRFGPSILNRPQDPWLLNYFA